MLLLSVNPPQQEEALDSFVKRISSSAVSFTYSCVIGDGGAEVTGEGTVDMQGDAYIVRGNGLEVYCDGRTRWTVDRQAQEAVVEAYDPDSPDYSVNPAALLRSFDKAFKVTCVSVSGKSLDYTLEPVSSGTDIAELRLSLSADASCLLSAGFTAKDGTAAEFAIPSFSFSALSDPERFVFDVSSLGSGYYVTDLR